MARTAGIVLAGGRSTRMGADKATLAWEGATAIERVVRAVGAGAGRVVVVVAAGQELPALPAAVTVVADARPGRGPLEGLRTGLLALSRPDAPDAVFVAAVDLPRLEPALVARVLRALGPGDDAAVPTLGGRDQPLAAAYRLGAVLALVEELAAGRDRSLVSLLARLRVRRLGEDDLLADPAVVAADPGLAGLRDLDTPADLAQARRENGTGVPAATRSPSSGSQARAVAPAREVTA